MKAETLSIRVEPEPNAAALSRVFVGNVLVIAGSTEQDIDDVRIAVSDLTSGLVEAGTPIEITAIIGDREVRLEGNAPALAGAGPLLLGRRMAVGEGRWTINLDLS